MLDEGAVRVAGAPLREQLPERIDLFLRKSDWIPGCLSELGTGAVEDEGLGPLGISGGEEQCHGTALRDPVDNRALRARGVHYRADVVASFLKAPEAQRAIG